MDFFPDDIPDDDSRSLREMRRLLGGNCAGCEKRYSAQEAVFSIVLGFQNAPRCLNCLAAGLGREPNELREQLVAHIHRRECFLRAWKEADLVEPEPAMAANCEATPPPATADVPAVADEWDAGPMGCGELVMALRMRMASLPPGGVLRIRATDPAAPEDLPAWCRLTGHALVAMDHPTYLIRRKGD